MLSSSVALAQPMMMDPSKMSGIPRPDPQVPAGTITVRLIRGSLDQRMPGVAVELAGPDGKPSTQKTDAEGRATFAGLSAPGPFVARAQEGETKLSSQPIELSAQMGSRVMLVFPKGSGQPDAVGRLDKTLPPGTIVVRAEDASGNAVDGVDVVVAHAKKGQPKVEELKGKTDTAGEARFDHLERDPTSGYLAQVRANGAQFDSKPFRLEETAGMRVVIQVRPVTADTSELSFAEGSHLLVEVTDDTLQVIEVLRLHNGGSRAVEAKDGLHIPLPRDALQVQAPDGGNLAVVGHDAVVRGPVPPGDTQLRVAFALAHHGGHAELEQATPVPFAKIAMVTQEIEGLTISGHDVVGEPRDMGGRRLMVYFGNGTTRDSGLSLQFSGLPTADPTPRYAAAAIAILIVVLFGAYATGGGGAARGRLEAERARLFDELTKLDAAIARGEPGDHQGERDKKVKRLTEIYRGLDELGGG
jgi:hypothetical protein